MSGSRTASALMSVVTAAVLAACTGNPAAPEGAPTAAEVATAHAGDGGGALTASGRGDGPIVYVTSQGLFFDSIITADPLPFHGKFQKLETGGPSGLTTTWGPGDQLYRGGRWWMGHRRQRPDGPHRSLLLLPAAGSGTDRAVIPGASFRGGAARGCRSSSRRRRGLEAAGAGAL